MRRPSTRPAASRLLARSDARSRARRRDNEKADGHDETDGRGGRGGDQCEDDLRAHEIDRGPSESAVDEFSADEDRTKTFGHMRSRREPRQTLSYRGPRSARKNRRRERRRNKHGPDDDQRIAPSVAR